MFNNTVRKNEGEERGRAEIFARVKKWLGKYVELLKVKLEKFFFVIKISFFF